MYSVCNFQVPFLTGIFEFIRTDSFCILLSPLCLGGAVFVLLTKSRKNQPAVKHYLVYVEKEFRCVIIICKSSVFTFIYKCFPGHGCCICISEQGNWVCVCVISFFHSCSSNWRESVWRKHCCVFFSGLLSELFRKASKFVKKKASAAGLGDGLLDLRSQEISGEGGELEIVRLWSIPLPWTNRLQSRYPGFGKEDRHEGQSGRLKNKK